MNCHLICSWGSSDKKDFSLCLEKTLIFFEAFFFFENLPLILGVDTDDFEKVFIFM